jgi:hypothetical protein
VRFAQYCKDRSNKVRWYVQSEEVYERRLEIAREESQMLRKARHDRFSGNVLSHERIRAAAQECMRDKNSTKKWHDRSYTEGLFEEFRHSLPECIDVLHLDG